MCEPDGSYERVRELAASSKRDVESTLVSFMLRLHPHYCLFPEYDQKVKQAAMSEVCMLLLKLPLEKFVFGA